MMCPAFNFSFWFLCLISINCHGQTVSGTTPSTEPRTAGASVTLAPKIASSTSSNKQFTIHGANLNARSAFGLLCEESAATLGRLLKDDGRFLLPIVVVLKTPPDISLTAPTVTTSISELSYGGFHFQITVQLRNDFRSEDFSPELVRVLLAERILRNHKSLQTTRQRVLPDWLLTGVSEAMEFRNRASPSVLFSAVFKSGQVYSIDHILDADPAKLDAMARGIYEASSCALVLTLLEQPDGPVRFTKFLGALAEDSKSDRDLLKHHFPTLGLSKNSLEKWWSLQMAALATPSPLETLSVSETELRLNKAITLSVENYVEPSVELPREKKKPIKDKVKNINPEPLNLEPAKEVSKPATQTKERKKSATPPKEEIKETPREKETRKPKTTSTTVTDIMLDALSMINPFMGGREILFPFHKSPKPADEQAKKTEANPTAEKKPDKSKKPEPPKTPEVTPGLPPKTADSRSISGKPGELPPISPEVKEENKPSPAPVGTGKKSGGFNPLGWFRKSVPNEKTEPPTEENKPVKISPTSDVATGSRKAEITDLLIEDYQKIWKRADRSEIIRRNVEQLNILKTQAHPLYKDIIGAYATALQKLVSGNDKGMTGTLEELHKRRDAIHEIAKAVESHLDWFEASGTVNYSGTFNDYFKLRDELDKQIHPRSDALSQYLDAVEKEYEQ